MDYCSPQQSVSQDTTEVPLQCSLPRITLDEDSERFRGVISAINEEALPRIAARIRGEAHCCTLGEHSRLGGYNIVFSLTFDDGVKWAARVPQHGTRKYFGEREAYTMQNEMQVLRMIRLKTAIPVPEVYYIEIGFDNELGAPFSLIQWLEGDNVSRLWFDTAGPTSLAERRIRILDSLVEQITQLAVFSSSTIGMPEFDVDNCHNAGVVPAGKMRIRDIHKETELSESTSERDPVVFRELGPFDSISAYLDSWLDAIADHQPPTAYIQGQRKLLKLMVDTIGSMQSENEPKSVLSHPDLDSQNLLAYEDGTISGIIDWDGCHLCPEELRYSKYPTFLREDWNPTCYGYEPMLCDMWPQENSPEELREFRRTYHNLIEKRVGSAAGKMVNSHIYEAIELACKAPDLSLGIVNKICRVCFKKAPFSFSESLHMGPTVTYAPLRGRETLSREDSEVGTPQDDSMFSRDSGTSLEFFQETFGDNGCLEVNNIAENKLRETLDHANDEPPQHDLDKSLSSEPAPLRPSLAITIQTCIVLVATFLWLVLLLFTFTRAFLSIVIFVGKVMYEGGEWPVDVVSYTANAKHDLVKVLLVPFNWLQGAYREHQMKEEKSSTSKCISKMKKVSVEAAPAKRKGQEQDRVDGKEIHGIEEDQISIELNETQDDGEPTSSQEYKVDLNVLERNGDGEQDKDDGGDFLVDNDLHPNERPRWWFNNLYEALAHDQLAEEEIQILKRRFAEVFGSTTVVEEWSMNCGC